MLTEEILEMLFEEAGMTFDEWVESTGYVATWSDQTIYNALPDAVKALCGDIVMNESWYHGGQ